MKKYFGLAVKAARDAAGLSSRQLSERSGVSTGTISAIENGEGNVTLDTANAIAGGFGIQLIDLMLLAENIRDQADERANAELEMRKIALKAINGKPLGASKAKRVTPAKAKTASVKPATAVKRSTKRSSSHSRAAAHV